MNKVIHFEIPVESFERAMEFYAKVFDWEIKKMPEFEYAIARTVKVDEKYMPLEKGAINGGMMQRSDIIQNPVITINVQDIDAAIEKLKAAGGEVIREKMQVGEMGYAAYFKDSEGNILGLWEEIKH